jgi:hypothetical protein
MRDPATYKTKALEIIRLKRGPVLVGEVALSLGPLCSLKEAEGLLTDLAVEGEIRRLTPEELEKIDCRLAYIAV